MKKIAITILFIFSVVFVQAQKTEPDQTPRELSSPEIIKLEQKHQSDLTPSEITAITEKNESPVFLTLSDILNIDLMTLDIDNVTLSTLQEILSEREQLVKRGLPTKEIDEKISGFLSRHNIVKK